MYYEREIERTIRRSNIVWSSIWVLVLVLVLDLRISFFFFLPLGPLTYFPFLALPRESWMFCARLFSLFGLSRRVDTKDDQLKEENGWVPGCDATVRWDAFFLQVLDARLY